MSFTIQANMDIDLHQSLTHSFECASLMAFYLLVVFVVVLVRAVVMDYAPYEQVSCRVNKLLNNWQTINLLALAIIELLVSLLENITMGQSANKQFALTSPR
jgi:hypothetical protein